LNGNNKIVVHCALHGEKHADLISMTLAQDMLCMHCDSSAIV